jgi:hypothetical protein
MERHRCGICAASAVSCSTSIGKQVGNINSAHFGNNEQRVNDSVPRQAASGFSLRRD